MSKVDEIMEQAQVFASAWSLVGGRFDNGNMLTEAEEAKSELRKMIEALAQPAQEAEPFVIKWPEYSSEGMGCGLEDRGITNRYEAMAYGWNEAIDSCMWAIPEVIYTTPQQSQPLTDEQIDEIFCEHSGDGGPAAICEKFARAIEAAHGIKGVTE